MTNPIPAGYHTITPHLVVEGASEAIEFYQRAFEAQELSRMPGPGGKLMHAELRIGDSHLMITDAFPQMNKVGPHAVGGTSTTIHLYVEDADATFERAVAEGAKVLSPMEDQFWGDRYGRIVDPFGHQWGIASRKEDLTEQEILERAPTVGL